MKRYFTRLRVPSSRRLAPRNRMGTVASPRAIAGQAIAISTCRNHPFSRSKKQGLSWSDTPMLKAGRG